MLWYGARVFIGFIQKHSKIKGLRQPINSFYLKFNTFLISKYCDNKKYRSIFLSLQAPKSPTFIIINFNINIFQSQRKWENKKMQQENNKQLCPTCKTGEYSYILDNRNPFCPHLHCHNGKTCTAYVPIEKQNSNTK